METFLRSIRNIVERFGLEAFIYMKDTDIKIKYIPEEPHNFTFASVLVEHASRLVEPFQDMDGVTPPVETPASVLVRSCSYDKYEK